MLSHTNIGTGRDISIREMVETMKVVVGYKGRITVYEVKPDVDLRKYTYVSKLEKMCRK